MLNSTIFAALLGLDEMDLNSTFFMSVDLVCGLGRKKMEINRSFKLALN